ncbi:MAG: protein translocase subunit SecD [Sedimentisphaerales bacterium]|nr:protein translocase subunit SecD [Sedimentisphaerales bacterium]
MNKNLTLKIIVILALVALATWTLYPPDKKLMPGIDLAGGTSLIYEIDTYGLEEAEKKDLAQRMTTVLRRRIDPANIQNLIWRPLGNTRFEIQMPLASAEARTKREVFEKVRKELFARNVSRARIMRSLDSPPQERPELFKDFAQGDPNRITILENLAKVYDERKELQNKRDELDNNLKDTENRITSAGIDLQQVQSNRINWTKLNEQALLEALKKITSGVENIKLLTEYVKTFDQWSKVVDQLTDPDKNSEYKNAVRAIDKLNLSEDQLDVCLEKPAKSSERRDQVASLKINFPDRADEIEKTVTAFDEYQPFKGRLDDPKDLQRMLKGAGILEWRILPTQGHPDVDMDLMSGYVERLKEKGPKFASDNNYIWCEVENIEEWKSVDSQKRPTIVAQFGEKFYVLASNSPNGAMLHSPNEKQWKLEKAYPTTDEIGRRAIGFILDIKGGQLFSKITGDNIGKPLCILLDGIAISAPSVESRISSQGRITGSFTQVQVEDLVNKLNAGSLPARLIEQPISINTIGPSIGAENRDQGIKAGFIGLAAVVACMAIYYCLAGSIADVALLLNMLFVLAIMAGVRATFTLPGIAGIILTIGMSVDANVLVFERIREEQFKGSSLRIAITNGYQRAFRTIFDANLTTFITAAILYWRASEEVKGFAIVLMLGIASSMFTALFVTRVIFDFLLSKRYIKDHLLMLRLIHNPNVNWMRSRPVFFSLSIILIAAGLAVFVTRDDKKNNKYDIEFTGGTSVQIILKQPLSRQEVEDRIRKIGNESNNPALAAANIYRIGKTEKQYEINTTETNKMTVTVNLKQDSNKTDAEVADTIKKTQARFSGELNNLLITRNTSDSSEVVITTSQMNQSLVKEVLTAAFPDADISQPQVDEVVNKAILAAFRDQLEIQQNLQPKIISEEKINEELIESYPELSDFVGGVKIECKIEASATLEEIKRRLNALQFKPDTQALNRYPYEIFNSNLTATEPNKPVNSFIYVSADQEAGFRELTDEERTRFVENEKTKVLAAAELETSLPRVRQFDPSVGKEQKQRALIAISLSLIAIIAYIWIRFGNIRYGIAAIIALVHDVCITLGAVTVCTYLASTKIGEILLIGDFKINLAMIAAFLTLIGYSLNDTIVIFDRIRENKGKARTINPQVITNSINQTISRTIMTSFTTFIVVLIMYIFGGSGLRGFNFAIGFGVIIGTYSSIAIAAPLLLLGTKTDTEKGK